MTCDNGLDEDSDGRTDYRTDGAGENCCTSPLGTVEQCSCVASLAGGALHTCAAKTSGSVFCWGDNMGGQLGDNSMMDRQTPVQVKVVNNTTFLTGITQVATGELHSCALKNDGTVWCWGRNMDGQLGDTTTMAKLIAQQVSNLTGVSAIAVGWNHSCAVKALDGSVFCWGSNNRGQLGNGTTSNMATPSPVQVTGMSGATQISAGELTTCVRKSDGTAWCWGEGSQGELGNNMMADSSLPVQVKYVQGTVKNLTGVSEVSLGQAHGCARIGASEVRCWGAGSNGELGNMSNNESARAELVANLTNPAAISAGGAHTCATRTTGAEVCWGLGTSGQLGNGNNNSSTEPVNVSTVTRVFTMGNGGIHSCSALETETTQCWGSDMQGQLGNGAGGSSNTPGPVTLTCP
jgi:alpha-tubulin suppressor-like RCC1 family protein